MPAACRQAGEQRALGGIFILMEGLRIELRGEGFDLSYVDDMRSAGEALADMQIVEIEPPVCGSRVGFGHGTPALRSSQATREHLAAVAKTPRSPPINRPA